jgi:hypothetical protein
MLGQMSRYQYGLEANQYILRRILRNLIFCPPVLVPLKYRAAINIHLFIYLFYLFLQSVLINLTTGFTKSNLKSGSERLGDFKSVEVYLP